MEWLHASHNTTAFGDTDFICPSPSPRRTNSPSSSSSSPSSPSTEQTFSDWGNSSTSDTSASVSNWDSDPCQEQDTQHSFSRRVSCSPLDSVSETSPPSPTSDSNGSSTNSIRTWDWDPTFEEFPFFTTTTADSQFEPRPTPLLTPATFTIRFPRTRYNKDDPFINLKQTYLSDSTISPLFLPHRLPSSIDELTLGTQTSSRITTMVPRISFEPPLFMQRRSTVLSALRRLSEQQPVTSLLDLGCGPEFFLLQSLTTCDDEIPLERVYGIDLDGDILNTAPKLLSFESLYPHPEDNDRWRSLTYNILHGSFESLTLAHLNGGVDVVVSCEVIEHLDPEPFSAFPEVVLGRLQPRAWIVTTPNREFNVIYELPLPDELGQLEVDKVGNCATIGGDGGRYYKEGVDYGMRHHDHKFEWTREEFREWADVVSTRYGYNFEVMEIGSFKSALSWGDIEADKELVKESLRRFLGLQEKDGGWTKEELMVEAEQRWGSSSQAAIFTRKGEKTQQAISSIVTTGENPSGFVPDTEVQQLETISLSQPPITSIEDLAPPGTPIELLPGALDDLSPDTAVLSTALSSSEKTQNSSSFPPLITVSGEGTAPSTSTTEAQAMVTTNPYPIHLILTTLFPVIHPTPYPPPASLTATALAPSLLTFLPGYLSLFWDDPDAALRIDKAEKWNKWDLARDRRWYRELGGDTPSGAKDMGRIREVRRLLPAGEVWEGCGGLRRIWRYKFGEFERSLKERCNVSWRFEEKDFLREGGVYVFEEEERKEKETSADVYEVKQLPTDGLGFHQALTPSSSIPESDTMDCEASSIDEYPYYDDEDHGSCYSIPTIDLEPIPLARKLTATVSFVPFNATVTDVGRDDVLFFDTRSTWEATDPEPFAVSEGTKEEKEDGKNQGAVLVTYKLKDDFWFDDYIGWAKLEPPDEEGEKGRWKSRGPVGGWVWEETELEDGADDMKWLDWT